MPGLQLQVIFMVTQPPYIIKYASIVKQECNLTETDLSEHPTMQELCVRTDPPLCEESVIFHKVCASTSSSDTYAIECRLCCTSSRTLFHAANLLKGMLKQQMISFQRGLSLPLYNLVKHLPGEHQSFILASKFYDCGKSPTVNYFLFPRQLAGKNERW